MRFTVSVADLRKRLNVVERIIPRRGGGLPYHHVVSIEATGDQVTLNAHGLKESYRSRFTGSVEVRGQLVVPAVELARIAAAAPEEEITILEDGSGIVLKSGSASWTVTPIEGTGYMPVDTVLPDESSKITRGELVAALQDVRYAAAKTEARPSLRQIHIGQDRVVAADGRRLHQVPVKFSGSVDLPEASVDALLDVLEAEGGGVTGKVEIRLKDSTLWFTLGESLFAVGRLSYDFPDLDNLILLRARKQTGEFPVDRKALLTAIKVAEVGAGPRGVVTLKVVGSALRVKGDGGHSVGQMTLASAGKTNVKELLMTLEVESLLNGITKLTEGQVVLRVPETATSDPGWLYIDEGGVEIAVRSLKEI